ncbi:lipoyl synthase [Synechococcus sp. GEYO]|uniref:lipoyl synthase n=1 Tax=Synechococcus sp. GEYO TaxID=2575511 RepID=UPI00352C7529
MLLTAAIRSMTGVESAIRFSLSGNGATLKEDPCIGVRKTSRFSSIQPHERLPEWLRRPLGEASAIERVQGLVKSNALHTICEEGRCPNRGECYAAGTATFLLGGSICTRSCAFCQVGKGRAQAVNPLEAEKVADAVEAMGLRYVVLTAVARDDLDDHGACLFTSAMTAIRARNPLIAIEVLTPDFWGGHADSRRAVTAQRERLATVLKAAPVCFNHNLETVKRLQREVRRGATFERSLGLLAAARTLAPEIPTKSGLMLGLGESRDEVIETMRDLRAVDCQRLTIGQYLRPSLAHIPVDRYWHPDEFEDLGSVARELGFAVVRSGPLVRSSYHAAD